MASTSWPSSFPRQAIPEDEDQQLPDQATGLEIILIPQVGFADRHNLAFECVVSSNPPSYLMQPD